MAAPCPTAAHRLCSSKARFQSEQQFLEFPGPSQTNLDVVVWAYDYSYPATPAWNRGSKKTYASAPRKHIHHSVAMLEILVM